MGSPRLFLGPRLGLLALWGIHPLQIAGAALYVTGSHGFEEKGKDPQVDKTERIHGAYLREAGSACLWMSSHAPAQNLCCPRAEFMPSRKG